MEEKAAEEMNACAVLGAAYASGCAPEGAAPVELDAVPERSKISRRRNAHLETVLEALTQRFPQGFRKK